RNYIDAGIRRVERSLRSCEPRALLSRNSVRAAATYRLQQHLHGAELRRLVEEIVGAAAPARRFELRKRVVGQHDDRRRRGGTPRAHRFDDADARAFLEIQIDDRDIDGLGEKLAYGICFRGREAYDLHFARLGEKISQAIANRRRILDEEYAQRRDA